MPKPLWKTLAALACGLMASSCAGTRRTSTDALPPRLTLPEAASRPCSLAQLPENPTEGDLDAAFMLRGAQVVACDGARKLAVETLLAERSLADRLQAQKEARSRPWWRWWP